MPLSAEATAILEARRRQTLDRMDRNDDLVREARAARIAAAINEPVIVSRVPADEFLASKQDKI
ncbi:hypothetical protein [Agrobacterium pusense]|uniref:hypothetical protein n=1 Tax=Agrobacterium pusense TaxID=648995 RepID=UPI000D36B51E|nr:hypothetical protein [Agrobacterium pusense]PTV70202.1 hypothetical protein DBL06_25395 [Agrobacterium pusense]